jgi:hypothetical protein
MSREGVGQIGNLPYALPQDIEKMHMQQIALPSWIARLIRSAR